MPFMQFALHLCNISQLEILCYEKEFLNTFILRRKSFDSFV